MKQKGINSSIQKNVSKSPLKNKSNLSQLSKASPIKTEKKECLLKRLEENLKQNEIQSTANKQQVFCQNHPQKKAKFISQNPRQQLCDQCAHQYLKMKDSKLEFTSRSKLDQTCRSKQDQTCRSKPHSISNQNLSINSFDFTENDQENQNDLQQIFEQQQQLIEKNFNNLIHQLQIQKQQALDENKRNYLNLSKNWKNSENNQEPQQKKQLFETYFCDQKTKTIKDKFNSKFN